MIAIGQIELNGRVKEQFQYKIRLGCREYLLLYLIRISDIYRFSDTSVGIWSWV